MLVLITTENVRNFVYIGSMITGADISKLKKVFATKEDLTQLEKKLRKIFMTKEEFFSGMDAIMGELKAMREELIVTNYRQRENTDRLEIHEERLKILEKVKALKS